MRRCAYDIGAAAPGGRLGIALSRGAAGGGWRRSCSTSWRRVCESRCRRSLKPSGATVLSWRHGAGLRKRWIMYRQRRLFICS